MILTSEDDTYITKDYVEIPCSIVYSISDMGIDEVFWQFPDITHIRAYAIGVDAAKVIAENGFTMEIAENPYWVLSRRRYEGCQTL